MKPPEDDVSSLVQKFRLLQIDSILLAVPENRITTIVSWTTHATLPFAPTCVLGVACVEGRMFTVIDPSAILNRDQNVSISTRPLIVALAGEEQLALAVDSADEFVEINPKNIEAPDESFPSLAAGVIRRGGADIILLNSDKIFPNVILGRERRRRRS